MQCEKTTGNCAGLITMIKLKVILLSLLLVQLLVPAQIALADTGPKPTMEFTFKQDMPGKPVTIISGTLYECEQSDCSDAAPLQQLGPQGFRCDIRGCSANAYGFAPYHKLEIEFSDGKTRQSNVFSTAGFDSKYTVTIHSEDLLVNAQFNPVGLFPRALTGTLVLLCLCVLVIGLMVIGLIILLIRRRSKN